ncbi:hypothetical protein OG455_05100 [Kitasatospora sp. NBC_01287]|uniref:DUF6777 domain-containing protein n=1 Tax=Kitasatospora sp. NBC_01287 TaxID=2903573 RepID=UPI00224D7EEE|nr:DUF6777 domain-containing protein [Kitasatospora sp. NBC_01287]MCX4744904.1 hypothetical protein [Kitasatospora sp. NBC_01287]
MIAVAVGVVVVAVVLAVILVERQPKSSSPTVSASAPSSPGSKVTLVAAAAPGQDPYTTSVAASPSAGPSGGSPGAASGPAPGTITVSAGPGGAQNVSGGTVGLYGGTEQVASCDVAQLSEFLTTHPDKGNAWAGVEGIDIGQIPAYLHTLTPVVLRVDTRVTNHGFAGGAATSYQSVLQAGTAVLVDDRGVPRARCACGNPLLPPTADSASPQYTGDAWSGFSATQVVEVQPAPAPVGSLVLVDQGSGHWFTRPVGGTGAGDRATTAPTGAASGSASASGGRTATATATSTASGTGPATATATGAASSASAATSAASSAASSAPPSSSGPPTGGHSTGTGAATLTSAPPAALSPAANADGSAVRG